MATNPAGGKRKRRFYTIAERIEGVRLSGPCAYCGARRAVNREHVIPRSLVRTYNRYAPIDAPSIPAEWLAVVGACFDCNTRKGNRRLVPPAWANRINQLNRFFPGTPWRVWDGDPLSPAFREVHV